MPGQGSLHSGDPTELGGYRLVGRLAEGGQGVVYLGVDADGGRVAVKLLRPEWLVQPAARARLVKEVAAARRVARFCTARVIEARLDGDSPFIVSEYVDGPSLAEHVRTTGPVTGVALDRLAIGTATALVAIHQAHVVHRDVKPANVVLGPDGPRMIDFGIARHLDAETTVSGPLFGTPSNMAPEQFSGASVGPPTDVFAWASTVVFAATGRNPFDAPTAAAMMRRILDGEPDLAGIPTGLREILARCLAKDPDHRPTAQKALLLLLGEPTPEGDVTVRSDTLAKAAQLVSPAGALVAPDSSAETFHYVAPPSTLSVTAANDRSPVGAWRRWLPRPSRLLVGSALVVAVVAAGTGVALHRYATSDANVRGLVASPSMSPSPSASGSKGPATEPIAGGQKGPFGLTDIQRAFQGRWTGISHQPTGTVKSYQIVITLDDDLRGLMEDVGLPCVASLVPAAEPAPTVRELHLTYALVQGPPEECAVAGKVTLLTNLSGGLDMLWEDDTDKTNRSTASVVRAPLDK